MKGNGVLGSVFYAFPAVAASCAVFSPLALFIAGVSLFIFQPILVELGGYVTVNTRWLHKLTITGLVLWVCLCVCVVCSNSLASFL